MIFYPLTCYTPNAAW